MIAPSAAGLARFWAQVEKTDGCWMWRGYINESGYGRLGDCGRQYLVHRLSFLLAGNELQPGQLLCHRCDQRVCVRPSHLFAGTHADNMADMVTKGRQARGEHNANARLTELEVREILRALAAKESTIKKLAARFGVAASAVAMISNGTNWRHVERPEAGR